MSDAVKWDGDASRIAEEIQGKDYIILKLSEYLVGKNAGAALLAEPEEIMEAHFFDEDSWIHIYEYDGKLWVNQVRDEGEYIDEKQSLRTSQILVCRKTIEYDKYGQAYFSSKRPVRIQNGENSNTDH